MLTDEELLRLETIAKEATPGPWVKSECVDPEYPSHASEVAIHSEEDGPILLTMNLEEDWRWHRNAEFIQAFNPETVLSLLKSARREKELEEEVEKLRTQLAGCGVAAMCNTEDSMEKQRVKKGSYGWSQSYEDVIEAVRREMKYRAALEKLRDGPGNKMEGWKHTWAHKFSDEALKKGDHDKE